MWNYCAIIFVTSCQLSFQLLMEFLNEDKIDYELKVEVHTLKEANRPIQVPYRLFDSGCYSENLISVRCQHAIISGCYIQNTLVSIECMQVII